MLESCHSSKMTFDDDSSSGKDRSLKNPRDDNIQFRTNRIDNSSPVRRGEERLYCCYIEYDL